jgi:hypothetical protein
MAGAITNRRKMRTGILLLTLCWAASGNSRSTEMPLFPYERGWLGADAAYSIPLNSSTTIWLFGDTFTGKLREPKTMIHNSIGIRTCAGERCKVTYWWSGMQTGHAGPFFKTLDSDYYWPLDGFVYQGKLYVVLEQMHATGTNDAFGFDYSGVKLATVSNPLDAPASWRITYQTIAEGNRVVPGVAIALEADKNKTVFVYLFTLFRSPGAKPFVGLTRLPCSDLATISGKSVRWQYLAQGSVWRRWEPATVPEDVQLLLPGNITEMTAKFRPRQKQWIAIYPTPDFLSNTASYSVANELTGPWTTAHPLFSYDEMKKGSPEYTPNVFCYAAKEHPELEKDDRLAVTYACNSTKVEEVLVDTRLYKPVLVELPKSQITQ